MTLFCVCNGVVGGNWREKAGVNSACGRPNSTVGQIAPGTSFSAASPVQEPRAGLSRQAEVPAGPGARPLPPRTGAARRPSANSPWSPRPPCRTNCGPRPCCLSGSAQGSYEPVPGVTAII